MFNHRKTRAGVWVKDDLMVYVDRHEWSIHAGKFTLTLRHQGKAVIPEAFRDDKPGGHDAEFRLTNSY
jgi:hypothetical protein